RVRLSASPRSTRSWSRRRRGPRTPTLLTRLSWHSGLHRRSSVRWRWRSPRVPIVRLVAVGLTLLIGLSGLAAGLELLANLPRSPSGPEWTGIAIGGGIAAYGIATIVGAVGTWRR